MRRSECDERTRAQLRRNLIEQRIHAARTDRGQHVADVVVRVRDEGMA